MRSGRRGHYCWSCETSKPNEAFSGDGHSRHVCKECSRLGGEELAYRQGVRDIGRLVELDGLIRRKTRKLFERYLAHPDLRIRAHAARIAAHDATKRAEFRRLLAMDPEEPIGEPDSFEPGDDLPPDEDGAW